MPDKIAVLIPCYNESKTVAKVIRDMRKALPESVITIPQMVQTRLRGKKGLLSVMNISRERAT